MIAHLLDHCFNGNQRNQLRDLGATPYTDIDILLEGKYGSKLIQFVKPYDRRHYLLAW